MFETRDGHYPNPYDLREAPTTEPGCNRERTAETRVGGPVLPMAAWQREMRWREEVYLLKQDRKFRRKRFLRAAGFWLLMAAAIVAVAAAILSNW